MSRCGSTSMYFPETTFGNLCKKHFPWKGVPKKRLCSFVLGACV